MKLDLPRPSLAAYLGLRDGDRDGLEPNPEGDTGLYVDLDGLIPACLARLAARAPKIVLLGDYGTGKTHLLHVLQAELDRARFETVYLKLEPFGRWAESRHLHDALLSAMERRDLLRVAIGHPHAGVGMDADTRHAYELLRETPSHPEARAWLFARGPTPAKAVRAGFSGPLSSHARGITYASMWRNLADAFRSATDRELLFLIDESETFQEAVDQTRAADMGVAIREMFDASNKSYGVVMALTAPKGRGGDLSTHPLGRPDVASRVQNIRLQLGVLGTPGRRREFITGLLDRMLANRHEFLSNDAIEALVTHGPAWARENTLLTREPVHREYVKLLDTIAQGAYRRGDSLPLTAQSLAPEGSVS